MQRNETKFEQFARDSWFRSQRWLRNTSRMDDWDWRDAHAHVSRVLETELSNR